MAKLSPTQRDILEKLITGNYELRSLKSHSCANIQPLNQPHMLKRISIATVRFLRNNNLITEYGEDIEWQRYGITVHGAAELKNG